MHWNGEKRAGHPALPCIRELDASDPGQDVDSHRRNANLIYDLLISKCLCVDPIVLKGGNQTSSGLPRDEGSSAVSCGPKHQGLWCSGAVHTSLPRSRRQSNTQPEIRLRVVTVLCNVGFPPWLISSANSTNSHAAAKMASSACSCQNSMSNERSGNPCSTSRVFHTES